MEFKLKDYVYAIKNACAKFQHDNDIPLGFIDALGVKAARSVKNELDAYGEVRTRNFKMWNTPTILHFTVLKGRIYTLALNITEKG